MNVAESFATYLQDVLSIATLGQDLYIGFAPSSKKTTDDLWWIVATGGNKDVELQSGESMKTYFIEIFFRSRDYRTVYDNLHSLEEQLNCDGCTQLTGFDTVDINASVLSIDTDLDNEDRKVGLLQANLITHKECE